jgi:hypothetical protein
MKLLAVVWVALAASAASGRCVEATDAAAWPPLYSAARGPELVQAGPDGTASGLIADDDVPSTSTAVVPEGTTLLFLAAGAAIIAARHRVLRQPRR